MNKEDALKRLASIEEETKELKRIISNDWTTITDFHSACKWLGKNGDSLLSKWKQADLSNQQIHGLMLETCIEAVNTENGKRWGPDWNNRDQYKYYNWFEKTTSGWVLFSFFSYFCISFAGAAMYFESKEKALHGAKHFIEYYKVWLG